MSWQIELLNHEMSAREGKEVWMPTSWGVNAPKVVPATYDNTKINEAARFVEGYLATEFPGERYRIKWEVDR